MNSKEVNLTLQAQGYFTISTDKRGKLAEFPNLIVNMGLDLLAKGNYLSSCYVGSGTVAPTVNDTQLGSFIAESGTIFNVVTGCTTSAPHYTYAQYSYRFSAGTALGNLSEVGIGSINNSVRTLFSRALIKDSFGNPTTITLLPDEILEVTYELRHYIPVNDVTGSITFTGNLAGTYSYTLRASNVTLFAGPNGFNGWDSTSAYTKSHPNGANAYSTGIATITSAPGGAAYYSTRAMVPTYINGTYAVSIKYTWGITEGNAPGGIRSIDFVLGIGRYQVEFNPPIPKTNMDTLSLTFTNSWARKE